MKRLLMVLSFLLIPCLVFSQAVTIIDNDGNPHGVSMLGGAVQTYGGGNTQVFFNDTDGDGSADDTTGSYQDVYLPFGMSCKHVLIQVNDGNATGYDSTSNAKGFLFSMDGGAHIVCPTAGISISLGKEKKTERIFLGKVKAATGNKLVIMILE